MSATTELVGLTDEVHRLVAEVPPDEVTRIEFRGAQFDRGLAWVHFPEGCGGRGLDREHQRTVDLLLLEAGAPGAEDVTMIGLGMAAPVIVAHGSEDQRARYLRPLFTGEEVWCQLFSEPAAGSDVAGLGTTAVLDGDTWSVTGQKVWTSVAHLARYGLLAARTDPDAPKHRGITYFVVDLRQPAVDVRPLRQLTGDAEFNEVFFDQASIPDSERLGAVGEGWSVIVTTLMNERVALGGSVHPRGGGPVAAAIEAWTGRGRRDPVMRDRLARLWIEAECLRLTAVRAGVSARRGIPGPEGSIGKLGTTLLNQRVRELVVDLLGPYGTVYDGEAALDGPVGPSDPRWQFLRSRANTIEGGTSEVMRNIVAERVLGLPGDVRTDRDVPWRDVPRDAR